MKSLRLLSVIFIATTIFVTCLSLLSPPQASQAQGGNEIEIVKTLNKTSNVVRVGELLTFTIALTNHSSFTITNVTLVDQYRQDILAYAGTIPPAETVDEAAGRIAWSNVATPPILSGQSISVTIAFTAEHPSPAVVNYARAEDVIFWNGQSGLSFTTEISQDAVGGNAPIYKNTWPAEIPPMAGLPVTFTHHITNDGAALMTHLPLSDTYDAAYLQFNFGIPTPTIITPPGSLAWDDLTDYFGDLPPFETVIVTTVFTALLDITQTVNRASTEGARDEYGNDLTAGEGEVPIVIVPQPTNTPTKEPTSKPVEHHSPTATPTPFPTPTVFPTPTPTLPAYPSRLPETGGQTSFPFYRLWGMAILLLGGGSVMARRRKRGNTNKN